MQNYNLKLKTKFRKNFKFYVVVLSFALYLPAEALAKAGVLSFK